MLRSGGYKMTSFQTLDVGLVLDWRLLVVSVRCLDPVSAVVVFRALFAARIAIGSVYYVLLRTSAAFGVGCRPVLRCRVSFLAYFAC